MYRFTHTHTHMLYLYTIYMSRAFLAYLMRDSDTYCAKWARHCGTGFTNTPPAPTPTHPANTPGRQTCRQSDQRLKRTRINRWRRKCR